MRAKNVTCKKNFDKHVYYFTDTQNFEVPGISWTGVWTCTLTDFYKCVHMTFRSARVTNLQASDAEGSILLCFTFFLQVLTAGRRPAYRLQNNTGLRLSIQWRHFTIATTNHKISKFIKLREHTKQLWYKPINRTRVIKHKMIIRSKR